MLPLVKAWSQRVPLVVSQLLASLLVIALAYLVYWLIARALRRARDSGRLPIDVVVPLERLVRIAAIIAAVMLVLQQFNVLADAWTTLTALVAVIGVGFVAVWSILSNAFCALVLLLNRPFQIGDEVELFPDQLRGQVVDFNLLFTILLADDGSTIQVPNNLFFQRIFRRRRGQVTSALGDQLNKPTA